MALFGGSSKEDINRSMPNSDMQANNILGKGTVITGDVDSPGNIRIEGKVDGNVNCKAKVVMGQSGELIGNIHSQTAEIAGYVKGTLFISETLILKPSANIEGDIEAGQMTMEPGASFNGSSRIGGEVKKLLTKQKQTPKLEQGK